MSVFNLAIEMARRAFYDCNYFETLNNIIAILTPRNLLLSMPRLFPSNNVDNDSIRTIAWSVMVYACKPAREFIKPYDLHHTDPEFLGTVQTMCTFASRPNPNTFLNAKVLFRNFVLHHWVQRPMFHKFFMDFCEQSTPIAGVQNSFRFKIQLNSLMDTPMEDSDPHVWRTTQLYHAAVAFNLPLDGSPMPNPFEHMPPADPELVTQELKPFTAEDRAPHHMALEYIKTYVDFLKSHIQKGAVRAMFRLCKRYEEDDLTLVEAVSLTTKRVLVALADTACVDHATVSSYSQTFLMERFYDKEIQALFNEHVEMSTSPEPRLSVRAQWESSPPHMIKRLVQVHICLWSSFYDGVLLGT